MDFLLTALPRSATTWASVWLMDRALCYHDPLANRTPEELRALKLSRKWGISDTTIWALPDEMKRFDCPIAILERDVTEIKKSMARLGAPKINDMEVILFNRAPGRRFHYAQMFDLKGALEIWEYLRPDVPMDIPRWEILRGIQIEPDFGSIRHDMAAIEANMDLIHKAARAVFGAPNGG